MKVHFDTITIGTEIKARDTKGCIRLYKKNDTTKFSIKFWLGSSKQQW